MWKIPLWITFGHSPGLWKSQGGEEEGCKQLLPYGALLALWCGSCILSQWTYPSNVTFLWEVLVAVHWYFQIINFEEFQLSSVCKGPVEGGDSKKTEPKEGFNFPFNEQRKSKPSAFSPHEVTQCRLGTVTFLCCHRWINPHTNNKIQAVVFICFCLKAVGIAVASSRCSSV